MGEKKKPHVYTQERSEALLRKSFEAGDRLFIVNGEPFYYVTSESQPWRLHKVDFHSREMCDCTSSRERGECRHVVRASWFAQNVARKRLGQEIVPAPAGFNTDGSRVAEGKVA